MEVQNLGMWFSGNGDDVLTVGLGDLWRSFPILIVCVEYVKLRRILIFITKYQMTLFCSGGKYFLRGIYKVCKCLL